MLSGNDQILTNNLKYFDKNVCGQKNKKKRQINYLNSLAETS